MKYIIPPILRFVWFLFNVIVFYPVIFIGAVLLRTIWNLDPKGNLNEFIKMDYATEDCVASWQKDYWYYRTPLDYLLKRKQYRDNPDYDPTIDDRLKLCETSLKWPNDRIG